MLNRGTLFIVSAPSGAGKTSLVKALQESLPGIVVSTSYTTRLKRPLEQEGVDYHFISESQFKEMIKKNVFLEYAEVFGCFYGTSKQMVNDALDQDQDVILEIDWQGARKIRDTFKDACSIFILPPNREVLLERLTKRLQDEPSVIQERMKEAKNELSHYAEYDYLVWNEQFDWALEDLKAIVKGMRLQTRHQKRRYREQLDRLIR